jgi:hypothetical protein
MLYMERNMKLVGADALGSQEEEDREVNETVENF